MVGESESETGKDPWADEMKIELKLPSTYFYMSSLWSESPSSNESIAKDP